MEAREGFTDLLDCIADDRGLFPLFVCNKTVVPRWIYASYWRRHGVVLRTRISTLGTGTDTVCIPKPWSIRIVIEYRGETKRSRFSSLSIIAFQAS
jgi:hypothetical protein